MTLRLVIDVNLSPEWVPGFHVDLEAGALLLIEPERSRVRILPL